jgi:SAM-dependent methyltransferase
MTRFRLYDELAHLWPLLSPPDDYSAEAGVIRDVLDGVWGEAGKRRCVVELGGGGGHSLYHLARDFDAVAVDLSPAMIEQSRKLNPTVEHHVADMRTVRLGRVFDAVLVHDAIDYMTSIADVRSVFDTAAAHLRSGGLLLVAPTYLRETFVDHQIEHDCNTNDQIDLTYVSHVHATGSPPADTTFELTMLLLIRERGRLRIEEDHHTCGLFDRQTWISLLDQTGFDVHEHAPPDEHGTATAWTLFVAIKR